VCDTAKNVASFFELDVLGDQLGSVSVGQRLGGRLARQLRLRPRALHPASNDIKTTCCSNGSDSPYRRGVRSQPGSRFPFCFQQTDSSKQKHVHSTRTELN